MDLGHGEVPALRGGSIHSFRRTATRDTVLRGRPIAAGAKVVTYDTSADRDEGVFPDPFTFDIRRSPNEHLSFGGGGPDFCLGAGPARSQIKAMVRELLLRRTGFELAGEARRLRSDFINGIKYSPCGSADTDRPAPGQGPAPGIGHGAGPCRGATEKRSGPRTPDLVTVDPFPPTGAEAPARA